MSCRIYLVRHGQTLWNAQLKFQGQTDIPLSSRGREQARALAKRLASEQYVAFYSSDLIRAMETARILAEPHGLPVQPVPGLREINFGAWEGLTVAEIKFRYAQELQRWWDGPLQTRIPGEGETLSEVVARVTTAVRGIVERHPHEQVVVVCHGGPIRALVGTVLGMDLNKYWRLRLDNACLCILEFSSWDKGILTLFNDCSHLEGGKPSL